MAEQEYMKAEVITVKTRKVLEEVQEPNGWTYQKAEIAFDDPETGEERKQILEQYYLTIELDKE